jgi:hypothetical protein
MAPPEALVMEDPRRKPARVLRIERAAETTRLAKQALPAAYQRALPIVQQTIRHARTQPESTQSHASPPVAAGASA